MRYFTLFFNYCNKNVTFVLPDNMKYSEFYKLLEANGWTIKEGKKHWKYVHPNFPYFIPVGRHKSKEIPNGTLDAMLKQAGLK